MLTGQENNSVLELLKFKTDRNGRPGEPQATIENYLTVFRNDPAFSNVIFNVMRGFPEIVIDGKRHLWTDADDSWSLNHIESRYGFKNESNFRHALNILGGERECNPALDRIRQIKWDGKKRCENFVVRFMNAEDNAYSRECSRLLFAGGINRIASPGCKFDCVIVFIGDQGGGKSTICQWLALEPEFYTSAKTISGQRGLESIDGKWIVELEELLAVIANDHAGQKVEETAKAFLSTQSDFWRKPYMHRAQDYPRHCVFIGTTNRSTFLTDRTGNRRWYPLRCDPDSNFLYNHQQEVKAEIGQCWAEMMEAFDTGDPLASPTPNTKLLQIIKAEQTEAEVEDCRIGLIGEYLKDKRRVCIADLWQNCLFAGNATIPQAKRADSVEIGEILTNKLHWRRGKSEHFSGFGTQKAYYRPTEVENLTELPF